MDTGGVAGDGQCGWWQWHGEEDRRQLSAAGGPWQLPVLASRAGGHTEQVGTKEQAPPFCSSAWWPGTGGPAQSLSYG